MKRVFAFLLSIVMIIGMIPAGIFPAQTVHAAGDYHYVLDTDGIDPNSVYLIVSASADGTAYALKNNNGNIAAETVTIQNGKIETVGNENDCLWTISGNSSGTVSNGSHYVTFGWWNASLSTGSANLNFAHFGSGKYAIYTNGTYGSRLTYLRYNNGWTMDTGNWGANGTNEGSYEGFVYLFKQVASTFTVTYDGNGATAGEAPESVTGLNENATVTVAAPGTLAREIGEDTYTFTEWNTLPDGTGHAYLPGETLTVADDITLYAQWAVQLKYQITVTVNLDGNHTSIEDLHGTGSTLHVKRNSDDAYIPLSQTSTGVYKCAVTENGDYYVYIQDPDGTYHPAHGHMIAIYNQDGSTTLQNYSITYNTGAEAAGTNTASWIEAFHANTAVSVSTREPIRSGYRFTGWKWNDTLLQPGEPVTDAIKNPVVLEAQWVEAQDLTVYITVNHAVSDGHGNDRADNRHNVTFQLQQLQPDTGLYLPVGSPVTLTEESADAEYEYDEENQTTTYIYTFHGLDHGTYTVTTQKDGYTATVAPGTDSNSLNLTYRHAPENFDFEFKVKLRDGITADDSLLPRAVNVKVSYWGYKGEELGWQIITQQEQKSPTTVLIGKDGSGTGKFSVWKYWPGNNADDPKQPYFYRIEITSFILPDGSIVAANSTDKIHYTLDGSLLYSAEISVPEGAVPSHPQNDPANLPGAYYSDDTNAQIGIPTVTYDITAFTVRFDANGGTIGDEKTLTLENQYRYPNLLAYTPEPPADKPNTTFAHWHIGDALAENKAGQYLTGDVVYTAHWHPARTVSGTITVRGSYTLDSDPNTPIDIHPADRVKEVKVVVQKQTGDEWNDIASTICKFDGDHAYLTQPLIDGCLSYDITYPNDGVSNYRIYVLQLNYTTTFTNTEAGLIPAGEDNVVVDAELKFTPEAYNQKVFVDASQISEKFRPTSVLAQITYRNMGSHGDFVVITQHESDTMGIPMTLTTGRADAYYEIWNWHTDGLLYEYQMKLSKLYGNVAGVFSTDGAITYDPYKVPYTIEYGKTAWFDSQYNAQSSTLTATLIPDTFHIYFDLGDDVASATVLGMEEFVADGGDNSDHYSATYTWSYGTDLVAFPYCDGFVFKGWKVIASNSDNETLQGQIIQNDGYITIPADMAQDIVLQAQWEKLDSLSYTIRYLERHTNKVLHGATVVSDGVTEGITIKAIDQTLPLEGYEYCGASIGEVYYDKSKNPEMTVTGDSKQNLMVIYYEPDGSNGFTDQVESNLHLDKTATLEDNGTYSIRLETFTTNNPITTQIFKNTPLDIVLVLDQSGSIMQSGYLDELQASVSNFINLIADHGREHKVNHRIALVGYAGDDDEPPTSSDTSQYPIAGGNTTNWVNTGVFDSNGDFHPYPVTGFNYTEFTGSPEATGTYYTKSGNEYLLLMHHDVYYHLIDEEEAKVALLNGTAVYGYVDGSFVQLHRNTSGLWLYGDAKLYSLPEFFTYHTDVWTHRQGLGRREIHAYGTGANYKSVDGHEGLYTREETRDANPELNVYKDALVPVSVGGNGSGSVNPNLIKSAGKLGSNGGTFVQYGIDMANRIFEANPLTAGEGRIRIMVMFTDGLPGIGTFNHQEADAAIAKAYITKNTHGAHTYTIGLYKSESVDSTQMVSLYMNAVSSNYPDADSLSDVYTIGSGYTSAKSATLSDGRHYFVRLNNQYYPLRYGIPPEGSGHVWYFLNESNGAYTTVSTNSNAYTNWNGVLSNYSIYVNNNISYTSTSKSGYYSTTESVANLKNYFASVVEEITTKITTEIVLHEDTILRDIMGQGLVLTPGTVITAYKQYGTYVDENTIEWKTELEQVADLTLSDSDFNNDLNNGQVFSDETTEINGKAVSYIQVYNLNSKNATNPSGDDYHPHTVDITGYDFNDGYINADHPNGYRLIVDITRVEARDDVVWGRSTRTNHDSSGLWLPADASGNRTLLLPFDQPSTIFVERAYVLDYAKTFTLSGWYFDQEGEKEAAAVHVDTNLSNGMNWFDEEQPTKSSGKKGKYGNITVTDGTVDYTPTTMSWGGYDQFYIFGDTWRTTVTSQDANRNGNLWVKVSVIPANNVYYEDSFIAETSETENGIDGFKFTGNWTYPEKEGTNTEVPEQMETPPYGDVHGWIDSTDDDIEFTDGTSVYTATAGASTVFNFTGTGVDIYTRTNNESGVVVAMLTKIESDGTRIFEQTIIMDNHAKSGDYYHVPTISFRNKHYGTYEVKLVAATASAAATGSERSEYYLDGIRVYNPLGSNQTNADSTVTDAYGKELNAVFTEVRDILLDYKEFNGTMPDSTDGKAGAVFIDWIREGQGTGSDTSGEQIGGPSYEIGTFEDLGPKNEVYLSPGQSIVLKVDPANTYYVGMKWLRDVSAEGSADGAVKALVSGITKANPVTITFAHTTDMYYQVTPIDGYIVIENASENGELLSITKLRTTSLDKPATKGGVLPITEEQALMFMSRFATMRNEPENPDNEQSGTPDSPPPSAPEPSVNEQLAAQLKAFVEMLFGSMRSWLHS